MNPRLLSMTAAVLLAAPTTSLAAIALPLVTDINGVFGGPNIGVDTTARFDLNNIAVYSLNAPTPSGGGGAGFGVSISNGENGINSSAGGSNIDAPNPNPLNTAIASVNGGGRLQNGNVIRFSAWFQQDPNDPIVKQPSVEPVLKLELWKEYGSQIADYSSGRKALAANGDRLWDTDINAPDPFWAGYNQSEAARIDLNNNGVILNNNGDPFTVSLPPTTGADWVLVETTLRIDDRPDDQPTFGWGIGSDQFYVDAIEEIRGTMFVGDYASTDLTAGGSFFVDNVLFEVFANEAALLATPNPNPEPKSQDFVPGDYNNDGVSNAADYTVWRDAEGDAEGSLPNDINGGVIGAAQYNTWAQYYGGVTPDPFAASSSLAIPEPTTVALVGLMLACGVSRARRS